MLITTVLVLSVSTLPESLTRYRETLQELLIRTEQLTVQLVIEVKRCNLEYVVIRWHLLEQRRVPSLCEGLELESFVDLGHLLDSDMSGNPIDVLTD